MSEIIRSFFFFTQEQNCFEETSLRSQIWADVSCTLNFPNTNPWVWLLLIYLTVFLPTDRKRYFEAQTTAFEVLRAIIGLLQTGILWWDGLGFLFLFLFFCFFHQQKKWLHQNVLCWRKYELIFAGLYVLQNYGQSVSVATANPIEDVYSIWS